MRQEKQDKLELLFDLIEHPEHYTESQRESLFNDVEVKELYQQLVETREAFDYQKSKEGMTMPSISDEWEKLWRVKSESKSEERRVRSEEFKCHSKDNISSKQNEGKTSFLKIVTLWPPMRKIAAIVAILVVSGIAFAAIHLASRNHHDAAISQPRQTIEQHDSVSNSSTLVKTQQASTTDSTAISKLQLVYENVELQNILAPISEHFHVSVSYKNESARHIRLYLQLTEDMNLDDIVELVNHFEKVNVRHEGNNLIVE